MISRSPVRPAWRYHVAHVSARGTVELIRQAKRAGRHVTAEVCPHHLVLTESACETYDPNCKMSPPLRSKDDVEACLAGVSDGTIDCLVSDHAPHGTQDKEHEFQQAPFGIIGLETSLGLFIKALIEPKLIDWPAMIAAMSTRPARAAGRVGRQSQGRRARRHHNHRSRTRVDGGRPSRCAHSAVTRHLTAGSCAAGRRRRSSAGDSSTAISRAADSTGRLLNYPGQQLLGGVCQPAHLALHHLQNARSREASRTNQWRRWGRRTRQ